MGCYSIPVVPHISLGRVSLRIDFVNVISILLYLWEEALLVGVDMLHQDMTHQESNY